MRTTPVPVSGLDAGVAQLAATFERTCALMSTGGVRCWGQNAHGGLGDGTTIDRSTPTNVFGLASGVSQLALGYQHTCALRVTGTVRCWGLNLDGQVGDGTATDRVKPVNVVGLPAGIRKVAAGGAHTCAITSGYGVTCGGFNDSGQLGDGTTFSSSTPVDVTGLGAGVVDLVAGYGHTCALMWDGAVRCWGGNWLGQLGDGGTTEQLTSVVVSGPLSEQTQLASGGYHNCAVDMSGITRCWGRNRRGQLGTGSVTTAAPFGSSVPVEVLGLSFNPLGITAGIDHTCALSPTRAVYCWGANNDGELGDGTQDDRTSPVAVLLG